MNSISRLAMPLKRTAAGKRLSPMILLTGIVATMLSTASMAQPQQQLIHVQGTGAMSVTPNAYSVTFVIEEQGETVEVVNAVDPQDILSINTPEQLQEVESILLSRINTKMEHSA